MNCDSNTACANDVGTESVCSTAKALFEPFVEYLESTVDKAYVTRNFKSGRKPPPEWLLKDFVRHRPNPSVLAHATMQDFQRPLFWVCWLPELIWCRSKNKAYKCQHLICPVQGCGGTMAAQKWVRDSVVGIGGMGMASTKNYKCKKCKKHCVGWKLVKSDLSMAPAIRREFPIVHFPKFTVLREVMSLVRSSTVNKMAFSAIADVLNELININEWRKIHRYYSYEIGARQPGGQQTVHGQPQEIPQLKRLRIKNVTYHQLSVALQCTHGKAMCRNGRLSQQSLLDGITASDVCAG